MASDDKIRNLLPIDFLKTRKIAVIGMGTMGSSILNDLALCCVGKEGEVFIVDYDDVEERNVIGTPYRKRHIGMRKVDAMEEILTDLWYDKSRIIKIPLKVTKKTSRDFVKLSQHVDLMCLFADDDEAMRDLSRKCYSNCVLIRAFFGEKANFGVGSFSIPDKTPNLNITLPGGRREERTTIQKPEALHQDTSIITSYFAKLCLSLLIPKKSKNLEELLPKLYEDAVLHAVGIRREWIFDDLQENNPMAVFIINTPHL